MNWARAISQPPVPQGIGEAFHDHPVPTQVGRHDRRRAR